MLTRKREGKLDDAISDATQCLSIDPRSQWALRIRALALTQKAEYAKAATDYQELIEINQKLFEAHDNLAYLLATCPDEKVRDGKKALEHATIANELTKESNCQVLNTLAAAYAELEDFEKATETQKKAIEVAVSDTVRDLLREHLTLYEQHQPLRDRFMMVPVEIDFSAWPGAKNSVSPPKYER